MKTLTLAEEHAIYKLAYEKHKEDIKISKRYGYHLLGMCVCIDVALIELYPNIIVINATDIPRFLALKPNNKHRYLFWWSTKNTSKTRIRKFKLLIKQTKPINHDKSS